MPTPADTALDNTDEHSTTALYRAAVGEVNSAYYLPLFARFEAADRAGLSWNGSAALYTLNWLAFRQLWHAGLVYAGVLVALALGIFGIGRLVFQFSDTTQWALVGGLVLLSVLLPGLGGNAVLHAATRKRMETALKATHTVAEACTLLGHKTPTRKTLIIQMVANVLVLALLGYAWLQFEGWTAAPSTPTAPSADARNVAVGRTIDVSVPAADPAPAPAASASAPASVASAPPAATLSPRPVASAPVHAASAPAHASAPVPAPAASASPAMAAAPAAPATAVAAAPAVKAASRAVAVPPRGAASAPAKIILLSKPIAAESAAIRSAPAAVPAEPPTTASVQRYVVNVGLFAQENNARNALTQLTDADLPASTQSVKTGQGTRIRVRVGPFDTQAEADRAADKVRAMGLDAQVTPQ